MLIFDRTRLGIDKPVLWTRGAGCHEVASLLSDTDPVRVQGDLLDSCVAHRAELLVSRRLSASSAFISGVSPIGFDSDRISSVVAAVAGGPHSVLAARVAARLGAVLDASATMISTFRSDDDQGRALSDIEAISAEVDGLEYRLVEAQGLGELAEGLAPGTLVVLGAPGGGWLRRMFFGPGAKLRSEATSGAVVVRAAATRAFQVMEEPVFVGPMLQVEDLLRTHGGEGLVAVVDDGRLIGAIRPDQLTRSERGLAVGQVMASTDGIGVMDPIDDLAPPAIPGAAEPVVDGEDRLVGSIRR